MFPPLLAVLPMRNWYNLRANLYTFIYIDSEPYNDCIVSVRQTT
jgi:hypothetical protein